MLTQLSHFRYFVARSLMPLLTKDLRFCIMNHLRQLCRLVNAICLLSETSSDTVPFPLTHIQIVHSELVEGVQRRSAPRPLTSRVSNSCLLSKWLSAAQS